MVEVAPKKPARLLIVGNTGAAFCFPPFMLFASCILFAGLSLPSPGLYCADHGLHHRLVRSFDQLST